MLLDDVPDWVPVDEREEYLYRRNYQRPSGAPRSFLPPPRPAPSTNASTLTVAACAALPPDVIAHVRDEAICACMADLQAARDAKLWDRYPHWRWKMAVSASVRALASIACVSREWRKAVLVSNPDVRCDNCRERRPQSILGLPRQDGCQRCWDSAIAAKERHWCLHCATEMIIDVTPASCWSCDAILCSRCNYDRGEEREHDLGNWVCDDCVEEGGLGSCQRCGKDDLKPWDEEYW